MIVHTSDSHTLFKEYRRKRGLSLREAAKLLELNHSFLSKIEMGYRKPSLVNLRKIGALYGMQLQLVEYLANLFGYKSEDNIEYKGLNYSSKQRKEEDNAMEDKNLVPSPNFNIDPTRTPVLYADAIYLKSNENGIVMDVAQQIGPTQQYNIVSRVGVSKDHAKRLIEHLEALLRSEGVRSTEKKE